MDKLAHWVGCTQKPCCLYNRVLIFFGHWYGGLACGLRILNVRIVPVLADELKLNPQNTVVFIVPVTV
jgi:hypothetical protein